jgi:hypothetical protein
VNVALRGRLIKAAVAVAALGVLGVLFVRSARSVRAEPFNVSRDRLSGWTLAIELPSSDSGVLLGLRPQRALASSLFSDVFSRTGESLSGPVPPAIPLILKSELDAGALNLLSPEALLALARAAGLESAAVVPRCMAERRVSAPGITRQVYFALFAVPAFDEFRRQVAGRLRDGHYAAFDPAALSPALIVAASDAAFSRWLPIRDADKDCFAPIHVQ